jgi:protein-L-isoaspartate(D-aspartate) O-methyltransferase
MGHNKDTMKKQLDRQTPREKMVRQQLVERGITDTRVLDAMRQIAREAFMPREKQDQAYADGATPIGHGQTISQPYIVALMTEKLNLRPTHRVLEIGTGSGYQTALLCRLAGEVFTVERVKPLLDNAFERVLAMGCRNVHFHYGDGTRGWPEHAPYDRILIAAGAPDLPRDLLLDQLRDGGIAVLPMGPLDKQTLTQVHRRGMRLETTDLCACRFVKLIGELGWAAE